MAVDKTQIGIAVGFAVGIIILIVCIMAPWRRKQPKKCVTIDTSKNETIPPTLDKGEEQKQEQEAPPAEEEESLQGSESKDDIVRGSQDAHRSQLLQGPSGSRTVMAPPTTAALMMSSMTDSRLENEPQAESTAGLDRITSTENVYGVGGMRTH